MNRLTKAMDKNNFYIADESNVQHGENGYYGGAVNKLGKFENMYDDLVSKQSKITEELDKLRAEGKTNSVKFKQLLTNKMANSNILILLKTYGLE